jgi:hypothetical protein
MFSKLNFMSAPANRDPVIPIGQAMAEKKAKRIRLNKVGTSILEGESKIFFGVIAF